MIGALRPQTRRVSAIDGDQNRRMGLSDGTIRLRKPVVADLPALADAIRSSQTELAPFMPWAVDYDEAGTLGWIRAEHGDEDGFVIVDPDETIVGACGLNRFNTENDFANLGYWIRTSETGNGYATRATRLLAAHGFDHHDLARVELLIAVDNAASRRVAERSGATFEGVLRRRLRLGNGHADAALYSIIPADL